MRVWGLLQSVGEGCPHCLFMSPSETALPDCKKLTVGGAFLFNGFDGDLLLFFPSTGDRLAFVVGVGEGKNNIKSKALIPR